MLSLVNDSLIAILTFHVSASPMTYDPLDSNHWQKVFKKMQFTFINKKKHRRCKGSVLNLYHDCKQIEFPLVNLHTILKLQSGNRCLWWNQVNCLFISISICISLLRLPFSTRERKSESTYHMSVIH